MNLDNDIAVVIPAAGRGARLGRERNKVLLPLAGRPMIAHTAAVFQAHPSIGRIVIVAQQEDFAAIEDAFRERDQWGKVGPLVEGGAARADSVRLGLEALAAAPPRWVLVHDGARPACSPGLVDRIVSSLEHDPSVVPALSLHDTVRRVTADGASRTMARGELFRSQTPQGFHWEVLWEACRRGAAEGVAATDEAGLVEAMGGRLAFVPGEARNLKITTEHDMALAEWVLAHPQWGTASLGEGPPSARVP